MQRQIIYFIVVLCTFFMLCCSSGIRAYAYTEEEKQQAKAWLSAHGYSPDMNGANQAYQDYLNGKFDEELGIATTEQQTTQEEEATTENRTEEEDEKQDKETQGGMSKQSGDTSGNKALGRDQESSSDSASVEADAEQAFAEEQSTKRNQKVDGLGVTEEPQQLVWYEKEKTDTYKEAGIVIFLSVMLVIVILGAWQLFRKISE